MAFNPFHHFRRYSKVVFAILAIICMLTFVLSSGMGRGDLLNPFSEWAGGGRRGGSVITLYGKGYTSNEVYTTQAMRQMANTYMVSAVSLARANLEMRLGNGLRDLEPAEQQQVRSLMDAYNRAMARSPQDFLRFVQSAHFQVNLLIDQAEARKKPEQANILSALRGMLLLDTTLIGRGGPF